MAILENFQAKLCCATKFVTEFALTVFESSLNLRHFICRVFEKFSFHLDDIFSKTFTLIKIQSHFCVETAIIV